MIARRSGLPSRTANTHIHGPDGRPVVKIDAVHVQAGTQISLTFESVTGPWRQGVFIATEGELATVGTSSNSLILWSDSAPATSVIDVRSTDGLLVVYNIWDSGRKRGRFESQSATSGMLIDDLPDGSCRYFCTDIGVIPDFTKLVFRLAVELPQDCRTS